ncbi:hypothetical protein T459_18874 [Capsicum annuum]|uniref:NAC domain-containing protein n=1 Tax=Capsicum annuum TaxID=4072 RepID=A0A2G2Z013_CAPAN|nr:hypothetical protein T459_18874 [Capsicum annuum]
MLSLGFRFHPTDEELINYLKNVVLHGMLPPRDFIKVADLFEDLEPWEIMAGSEEQTHYFLSQLKRFKNSTKKFSRTVGKGTWKGQNSDEYFRKSSKNYTFVICKIKEKKKNKGEEVDDEFIDYVLESIPDNHQLITNDDDNQFAVNYEVMRTITLHEDYGGGVEDFNGIDHLLLGVEDINDENCCIDYDELLEIIG